MQLKDKVIIVTGASSGIGWELALQLAQKGAKVVVSARRMDKLADLATLIQKSGGTVLAVPTDVADRSQVNHLVLKSTETFGRLDVFVVNAGVTHAPLDLVDLSEAEFRRVMETNLMGSVHAVWAAAPQMIRQRSGQFVFVSSVVGKRGIYQNAAYCASKFAMQGLSESIRPELRKKGVHVLTVCPPGVDTPFFEVNGRGALRRYRLHSPQKIAKMIVDAMEKEKREILPTIDAKALAWASFLFPGLMDWAISKRKGGSK